MASRNIQAAVYFLLFVTLVVVQVSVSAEETASASADEYVCDVNPNPNDKWLKWPKVKKTRKGVCAKGKYLTCEVCEVNTVKKKAGLQQKCQSCSVGTGTAGTGYDKCYTFCKEGRFFNTSVFEQYSEDYAPKPECGKKEGEYKKCPRGECHECPVGTYMPVKCLKTECIQCPNNQTTARTGTKRREDCRYLCPAGEQGNVTLGGCEPCPEGTYKEEEGLGMCKPCGGRFTTMTDRASNQTRDCVPMCDAGKEYTVNEVTDVGSCEKCPSGTFKAEPGNRARCEPCGLNRNTQPGEKGATSCEVECSEGWEPNGRGGCSMCDFGWFKPKQENASCTQCGMAKTVRKVTKERGSTNKASCVKLDSCVRQGMKDINDYYTRVSDMNDKGKMTEDANIVSFMKDMCFEDVSLTINDIVYAYRTCPDFNQLVLNDITIGSRTYKGDVQKTLFREAANHGNGTGHYCHYFSCMVPHMEEFDKCKAIMEVHVDQDTKLEYCSMQWRAGALCTMLNVKNCPPLRYHPHVTDDVRLNGVVANDVYTAKKIQTLCHG